ncbi:glutamate receptor-like [Panulirus ornatus]|uniref:glutamate receptor-like n=1 Tax=Panulirus ornatus TaxID=150431 RepID=UPI003A87F643
MTLQKVDSPRCLKICVDRWWPHLFVLGNSPPYRMTGSMLQVMDIIAAKLKFCMEYLVPEDRHFGTQLPNGTWTGMVGLLTREVVNMSGVIFSVDQSRARAVDFSVPLYMNTHVLTYVRPVLEPDVVGFVKPYPLLIWALLGVALTAILSSTFCIQQGHAQTMLYTRKLAKPTAESVSGDRSNNESLVWYSCLWTLTALLAQSCYWLPRGDPVRVITGLWLLVAFVVSSVYRSNLKAMLILPKLHLPFDNMQELVETGLETYMPPGSILDQALQDSTEGSLLHQLNPQVRRHTKFAQAHRDLLAGRIAGFIDLQTAMYIIHQSNLDKGTCPLYMASETYFGATSLSLAFTKGSPLKEKVDPILQNLKEFGILDHLFQNGVRKATECVQQQSHTRPHNNLRSLELGDFHGVFLVYSGGMVVATITFTLESGLGRRKA